MAKVKKHPHAGKTGLEREFIKIVHDLAGYRNHREVFEDFLELAFCAICKPTYPPGHQRAEALEARYMETVKRHKPDYIRAMPKLLGTVALALGQPGGDGDFLGRVSGELGSLNTAAGQFFTPFEVSRLMAGINLTGVGSIIEQQGFVTIEEPACGAGGMILAAAEVIEGEGFDVGRHMYVEATDISQTAFKMTYLQLSLRGVPATVIRGNTISLERWEMEITPAMLGFVAHHGERWKAWCEKSIRRPLVDRKPDNSDSVALPPPQPAPTKRSPQSQAAGQLSLFS